MSNIVFYGDSITDCGRNRELDALMGYGYPALVTGRLSLENPEKDSFFNRGISGNRIVDLYAQINGVLNLSPDVISILIGVNDVWHKFSSNNGVETKKFEMVYTLIIEEFLEKYPDVKIMILEPFVLHGTATDEHWEFFDVETKKRADVSLWLYDTDRLGKDIAEATALRSRAEFDLNQAEEAVQALDVQRERLTEMSRGSRAASEELQGRITELTEAIGNVNTGEYTNKMWALDNRKFYNHGLNEVNTKAKLL